MGELLQDSNLEARVRELAGIAFRMRALQELRGQPISPAGAAALVFLEEGRNLILLSGRRKGTNIAPDISFHLSSLPLAHKSRFIEGAGFILVGSTVRSIEEGVGNGWDDEVYLSIFNEAVRGTPIPQETKEKIQKRTNYQPITPREETEKITRTAIRDKTFAKFFQDPANLPCLICAQLLSLDPNIQELVRHSAQIFSSVVKQLNPQRPPTT